MNPQLPQSEAHPVWEEQQNPGVRSHCRRVAAWALEIASTVGLPASDKILLEQLCLLHHVPSTLLHKASRLRLLHDVAPGVAGSSPETNLDRAMGLLDVHRNEARFNRLFEIFETANTFDEQLEMLPFEGESLDEMLERKPWEANPAVLTVLPQLRKVTPSQLSELVTKLPVFPDVAAQAVSILQNPNSSLADLDRIARRDQVLAGELISVANSPLYLSRFPVTTVTDAAVRIGVEAAQRVVTAAAIRPLLHRQGLDDLWRHSMESAAAAERIASLAGLNAEEGFLLGLIHDVGRLLFSQLPKDLQTFKDRLIRYGCQSAIVEQLLTGMDHAEAGALVLRHWRFPERIVTGVLHHHQPERTESPLAALLYLTEFWTASDEDIASNVRLHAAEQRLGIQIENLEAIQ